MYTLHVDGASRGNPGKASIGCVLTDTDEEEVFTLSETIGKATNNVAEYTSLIRGMEEYIERDYDDDLSVNMDSLLVVNQVTGKYKTKNLNLMKLRDRVLGLQGKMKKKPSCSHVRREYNKRADQLANMALDSAPDNLS